MPANDTKRPDHDSLRSPKANGPKPNRDQQGLSGRSKKRKPDTETHDGRSLENTRKDNHSGIPARAKQEFESPQGAEVSAFKRRNSEAGQSVLCETNAGEVVNDEQKSGDIPEFSERSKTKRKEKQDEKDAALLGSDNWIRRHGHNITYIGLYLFSFLVLFRPYEIIPGLGFLASTPYYVAFATLAIYLPTQLSTEGNLTVMSTEVKCVLAMTLLGLLTILISRSPILAWDTFNDNFIKAVVIFIVMVNVLRTRKRLMGVVWLALVIAAYLSYSAWTKYLAGEFTVEGYRINVDIGGMYANPNDMALHLVMMTPIAIALGIAARNNLNRTLFMVMGGLFILGNMVTFSRGGFLGLLAAAGVLAWKFGREYRLNVSIASIVVGGLVLLFAPGNYGLRILSIFVPGLDPVGSRAQRTELFWQSLHVTVRNPFGIGMGNFNIISSRHLGTHNAYTQVSTELGLLGLLAYIIFVVSPFRKLGAIERREVSKCKNGWFYCLSIGLQASIVGFMVSSFFAAVAYNWYVYYLIAYAVAFRRIYQIENDLQEESSSPVTLKFLGWQNRPT